MTIEVSTKEIGNIRQRIYAGGSVRKKREKSVVDNAAAKSGRRRWIKGVLFAKLGEANLIGWRFHPLLSRESTNVPRQKEAAAHRPKVKGGVNRRRKTN